jgi:SPP1 family phage portal protein
LEQLELIKKCFTALQNNITSKNKYKKYYKGDHDIYRDYKMIDARSNQKIVKNYNKLFINREVGYLLSNGVNYISKDGNKDITDVIDLNFSTWEKLHNQELLRNCLIYGESYELDYINSDKEFGAIALNPLNGFVLEDGTADRNVLIGLHFYADAIDSIGVVDTNIIKKYLDVYTDSEIITYDVTDLSVGAELSRKPHNFNRVPMQKLVLDEYGQASLEDYKTEQDSYNATIANYYNESNDHRMATLFSKGLTIPKDSDGSGDTEEFYQEVVNNGWVNSKNPAADMKYVVKDIGTFVDNLLTHLQEDIYECASHINEAEAPTSNTSGDALRQRLHALENKVSLMQSAIEFVLKKRLRLFFDYYYKLTGTQFNYKTLTVKFSLNIPKEITTLANAIPNLKQVFSNTTILSLFGMVENPEVEHQKWLSEQEMELNPNPDGTFGFDSKNKNVGGGGAK